MRAARGLPIALALGFQLLFFVSVFAHLGGPLLWEDEAETAMHGRSVLEYGVPKIHVGDNVVYGAALPFALGRNERLDAYLGSPWGQYYFAAPAVAWSDAASDLATRTWRARLPFTLAGWLGVLLLGSVAARWWPDGAGSRAWFWVGFGAFLVLSVSLQLHLREMRYYPLVVLALGVLSWLSARGHTALLVPALLWLFSLFYPGFTAWVATATCALALRAWRRRSLAVQRDAVAYGLACAGALPVAVWFRVPDQSRRFFEVFGEDYEFLEHLASVGHYLVRFELLAPVALGAIVLAAARWQLGARAGELRGALVACDFALALTAIWALLIARTPLFFSRYLVPLSPVIAAACVLQIGCLVALRRNAPHTATAGLAAVAIALAVCAAVRAPELRGRIAELREPYRGPLDHVIPYLIERYPNPADLVIATNYEEFSFMFYLRATTVLGYFAPERERDLTFEPDVIIPRPWPVNQRALLHLASQARYVPQTFPVANTRANNLPDLSPRNQSRIVHRFRSPEPGRDGEALLIGERQQP